MKLISSDFRKGFAKVLVQTLDDLWVLSHVIEPGNLVSSKTTRKIKKEDYHEGKIKPVYLKLKAEKIDFHKYSDTLRVLGTVEEGPEDVPKASHHTIVVQVGSIIKIEKTWPPYQIKQLRDAVSTSKQVEIALIAVDSTEATFAELRQYGIKFTGELKVRLPRKDDATYEKKKLEFRDKLFAKLGAIPYNIILGGTGFSAENLKKTLPDELKDRVLFCKIHSGGKTGINEMVKQGYIERVVADSRVGKETKLVEKLLEAIHKNTAAYGIDEVKKAHELGAIDIMLITNEFIEEYKLSGRFKEIDDFMQQVVKRKSHLEILSADHEAGRRLQELGGIAALLRFKIQ
jgi:protein pelota